uniref:DMT family transporter n=1 Tax=Bacillus sp. OTU530 TaxID=3043862 RepID=UPI00313EE215
MRVFLEWFLLLIMIVFEVTGTISIKMSEGLIRPLPTIMIFVCYGICFSIFSLVVKKRFWYKKSSNLGHTDIINLEKG